MFHGLFFPALRFVCACIRVVLAVLARMVAVMPFLVAVLVAGSCVVLLVRRVKLERSRCRPLPVRPPRALAAVSPLLAMPSAELCQAVKAGEVSLVLLADGTVERFDALVALLPSYQAARPGVGEVTVFTAQAQRVMELLDGSSSLPSPLLCSELGELLRLCPSELELVDVMWSRFAPFAAFASLWLDAAAKLHTEVWSPSSSLFPAVPSEALPSLRPLM